MPVLYTWHPCVLKTVKRIIVTILFLFVIIAGGLGGMIVFGTKPQPPPLESIGKAFGHVDLSDLPALQTYPARDGKELAYRKYPGGDRRVAVLVHGSSSRSDDMHPMARALSAAGFTVYALDIRGHDQIRKGNNKARFCADQIGKKLALNALAFNATTLGIPCIYYGSEQGFDGRGGNDRYIREAMFGGEFGPFESRGRHCFNENTPHYVELAKILGIRKEKKNVALRRGRQYLREISGDGISFGLPRMFGNETRSIVAWSRIFDDRECLLAINTDTWNSTTAWITIDDGLHRAGTSLTCIYSTQASDIGGKVTIEMRNGKAVSLTVPLGGFVIYQ